MLSKKALFSKYMKWLKDRQERQLQLDEIRTYCRIVTALKHTMAIQQEIDEPYAQEETDTVSMAEASESSQAAHPTP